MGEVVRLDIPTTAPHEPDDILEAAKGQDFQDVVVVGLMPGGKEAWVSASTSDVERVSFLMQIAHRQFLDLVLGKGR